MGWLSNTFGDFGDIWGTIRDYAPYLAMMAVPGMQGAGAAGIGSLTGTGASLQSMLGQYAAGMTANPAAYGMGLYGAQGAMQGAAAAAAARKAQDPTTPTDTETQADRNAKMVDEQFGRGSSPTARQNASLMRTAKNRTLADTFAGGKSQADTTYGQGLTNQRIALGRSGLLGSGMDKQGRGSLLGQYFGNMTGAQEQTQATGQDWDRRLGDLRNRTQAQVRGGQIVDTTGLQSNLEQFRNGSSNNSLISNFVGGALPGAASGLSNYALASSFTKKRTA